LHLAAGQLKKTHMTAVLGLLAGAFVWGVIWYPFRVLDAAGISGAQASLLTYVVAFGAAVLLFRSRLVPLLHPDPVLILIAVIAGWANLAYVLGTIRGEVMQVLLLFYLAPLWTILFARALLQERAGAIGMLIVGLSLAGAAVMLWRPGMRLPVPGSAAEWLGLSAGVAFALSNVLIRKAGHHSIPVKSTAVFAGVILVAAVVLPLDNPGAAPLPAVGPGESAVLLAIGLAVLVANLAVQHGLIGVSANQAIVILLSELVVAAASAYLLAGEVMQPTEWIGGGMIVAATLLSGRLSPSAG
jgi:drug/metabolite transporter (DMT)-like permease